MREMKDSGIEWIGDIPKNWKLIKTKRNFSNLKRVVGSLVDNYERLSLTLNGVIKRSKEDVEGLQPEKFENYQILKKNELVFKLIDLENIKTSRVGLSPYTGIVSPAYIVISNSSDDNRYFYYWFMFMYYNKVFNHIGDDGVRSSLSARDVMELRIPSIDFKVQKRIANYLDDKCSKINTIIKKQQTIIEKLKEYKMSLITETVTKGLKPDVELKDSGIEFVGNIPKHWEILKFGKCAIIKSNLVKPNDYLDYPQISPDSIEKNSGKIINYKTVKESGVISSNHLFFKGQIIYSKIRPALNKITIVPFNGLCSADMYPIETKNNVRFILFMMLSNYFASQVKLITEDRVKMLKINQKELNSIIVIIPPVNEQMEIADFLDKKCNAIDSSIQKKQAIIDKLTEYKKSLIYEVVTGKKEI